jgi:Flp pilus assembly protein CpaB
MPRLPGWAWLILAIGFATLAQLDDRVAATLIMPGDLILENKPAPKGTVPGISALLSPNQRAMTVKVDEASGVAGFLHPGSWVDVVVVVDKGEYNKSPLAKLLFQNLKVLGTGQNLETRPGDQKMVKTLGTDAAALFGQPRSATPRFALSRPEFLRPSGRWR